MLVIRLAVALALASTISVLAQPVLKPASFTLTVVDGTLMDVFDTIVRATGIKIELDDAALAEAKSRRLVHVNFQNAQLEDALRFLTNRTELTLEVVDETTIRIRVKP
jgi:hypothetical protein